MKSLLLSMGAVSLVGGGAALAAMRWPKEPLTEPDAILEIQSASLTSYLPTASTPMQGVRPRLGQRGAQLDGASRKANPWGLAMNGNPLVVSSGSSSRAGGIDIANGAAEIFDVDLSLPSKGIPWVIGRTYNARQVDSGGTHQDSAGYQGKNWFQLSNPELVLYDADGNTATKGSSDVLVFVYRGDAYAEFQRTATNSENFRGINGCAGVIQHVADGSSEPGYYMYVDQGGNELFFFDNEPFGSADAGSAAMQLWKMVDPAGNVAYFGDPTTRSTAITNGYSSGRPHVAYDATNRRYTYTYDGSNRLTQVIAEILTSGTWTSSPVTATVGQVNYTYYTSDADTYGDNSDLKLVEIDEPLTDSGVSVTKRKYYRYYEHETAYNSSTYPGNPHQIQLIVGFEGCRNYDYAGDSTFDQDYYSETTANLKPYAEAYFEYEDKPNSRITKSFMNGQCGCSGNSNGTFTYSYGNNGSYSDNSGYDTAWMFRTIVAQPDGSYLTQYFDEVFQPLSRVFTDADPSNTMPAPSQWATYVHRTSTGLVDEVGTPANVTGYTHSSATFTRSSSVGLIWKYDFISSGHTTENFVADRLYQDAGTGGSTYYDRSFTYDYETWKIDAGDAKSQVVHPLIASDGFYVAKVTTASGNDTTTSFSYSAQGASNNSLIALMSRTTTEPAVTTGHNGSNSSNTKSVYWNADGTLGFEKDELGYITYHEWTDGRETKTIRDADTTKTAGGQDFYGISIPSGFSSSGSPLHHVATMTYDAQGRLSKRVEDSFSPLTYYSKLKDERLVTLQYTDTNGTPTYFGPVSYEVRNQAGRGEASGLIGLTSNSSTSALTSMIDETTADVKSAVAVGSLKRLTTRLYDASGTQMSESRLYTTIPGSLPGSSGTNYDATTYAYDDMGRVIRTEEPSGTVRRTVFDARGRVSERWVGTNDYGSTGTDNLSGPANILKVESLQYDGGSDKGNDYLTQRTLDLDDTPTTRVTAYTNDAFGKPVIIAPPTTPYTLNLYDNLHRVIATGLFTSTSGLTISSDPTAISTNRRALVETKFDELRRVWRTIEHKIGPSSGTDVDTLNSDNWYGADGDLIKVQGRELKKIFRDRLHRVTNVFTLANTDDAAYTDADDVSGDVVLEEDQTTYDASDGKVIMHAVIQRNHDDVGGGATTGALDTNADGLTLKYTAANVKGRIQITAFWNGLQGVTDQVEYGTYGGSDFDRSGLSVPSRSTTALRTTYTYNNDNTIDTIQDPSISSARYLKYSYDDAGRKITEIRNYLSGTNSGNPYDPDVNVTTRWAYTNGLMTSLTADLPSGQTDQVTTYTYGTTKGTGAGDSKIATGHLLQKITYPDSSDSGDVVKFAYNGQEDLIWKKDQEPSGSTGNVIESDYDGVGRLTERRVTTLGTNFDNAVLRIETTYDTLGRPQLVTQYDNATVGAGNVVNEVRYTRDGIGNITVYEEDPNSAVDAGGSVDDYEIDYAYDKNTSARQTFRRKSQAFAVGTSAVYQTVAYTFTSNYDGDISRVSQVKIGSNVFAEYEYLGSNLVVGDNRPTPAIFSKQHSLVSAGTYSQLDRFNRRVNDHWTKDLASDVDFFSVDNTWDENGNITTTKDNVQAGFDVKYTMDGLDRVTEAKEGTLSGGSITGTTRDQQWTLNHTGNWTREKLDLDGNGNFTGTGEHDDTRTHDDANELTAQDTDSNGSNNNTLAYDPAGNLTDDGVNYKYVYDAFYRLRFIKTQGGAVVEEFTYNGLGHQIGWHYDNDRSGHTGVPDGTVDSNDSWYYKAYDENWRQVATFRGSDATPKELFILQQAGNDGLGGASYINGVICRKRDADTAWTAATDGVLEEKEFYCQNWRGDVVGLVDNGGSMTEWAKHSAYGVPFCLPVADTTSVGARNSTSDANQIQTWITGSVYDVRGDTNLDGVVNTTDKNYVMSHASVTGGRGILSVNTNANRIGLAGYSFDDIVTGSVSHVRRRELDASRGQWLERDPAGYRDGDNLYQYCADSPLRFVDPSGMTCKDDCDRKFKSKTLSWCLCNANCSRERCRLYATHGLSVCVEGCLLFAAGAPPCLGACVTAYAGALLVCEKIHDEDVDKCWDTYPNDGIWSQFFTASGEVKPPPPPPPTGNPGLPYFSGNGIFWGLQRIGGWFDWFSFMGGVPGASANPGNQMPPNGGGDGGAQCVTCKGTRAGLGE